MELLMSLIRGFFKSVPIGNPISEIFENFQQMHANASEGPIKELPHKWMSILAQLAGLALIAYSMLSHHSALNDLIHQAAKGSALDSLIHQ